MGTYSYKIYYGGVGPGTSKAYFTVDANSIEEAKQKGHEAWVSSPANQAIEKYWFEEIHVWGEGEHDEWRSGKGWSSGRNPEVKIYFPGDPGYEEVKERAISIRDL